MMDCQIRRVDGIAEMVLVGSLDSSWSSYLADRIDEVVRSGVLELRIDMAGVSYLSSNGIALLVRYHKQLRQIGGRFRIVADSEAVSHVLRLTGVTQILGDDSPAPVPGTDGAPQCEVAERGGVALQIFPKSSAVGAERLQLIGDPARVLTSGYDVPDERTWMADPGAIALGLGALGPNFETCRGRFGEFLAVAGVAAYRPSAGPGRPDFEQAVGAFVPAVRLLYGLAFTVERAAVIRFEAKGEPGSASVPLSQIAEACLDQAGGGVVGLALAGESAGLVGAALRRSPVGLSAESDLFAHPEVRDWLSLTPEPDHSRSTALVVGVATREAGSLLSPFVRPLSGASAPELQGHFHAAVVPYRPLPGGAVELAATVSHLLEPGRIETILHLLCDSRPIIGAGESTFTRGVIWYVPLVVGAGTESP
jgi:anti-sigma B factor antagonist